MILIGDNRGDFAPEQLAAMDMESDIDELMTMEDDEASDPAQKELFDA